MREIKYRGLTKEGKLVKGYYVKSGMGQDYIYIGKEGNPIWDIDGCYIQVIPETVGQYTGLNDKNEQEGYRSDIVSFGVTRRPQYLVEWCVCNACFQLRSIDAREEVLHISNIVVGKVIGNIHQNPELMEKQ